MKSPNESRHDNLSGYLGCLVSINVGAKVEKFYVELLPKSLFPELPHALKFSLSDSDNFFIDKDLELLFRGKQHLAFIRIFISKLKDVRYRISNVSKASPFEVTWIYTQTT